MKHTTTRIMIAQSKNAVASRRAGSTLIVVLALLGLLALLGIAFARFALQEDESADYYTDSTKKNEDSEPPIDDVFNEVLAQLVLGAYDSEDINGNGVMDPGEDINGNGVLDRGNVNSAMFGGRHSLLGTMFGRDLSPYSGHGLNLVRMNEDRNNNGTMDPGEDLNGNGLLDTNLAVLDQAYQSEDANNNGVLDPGEDRNGDGMINNFLVGADQAMLRLADFPGAIYEDLNNNGVLDAGEDLNGNGVLDVRVPLGNFPDPDTAMTYPNINNAFLGYDGYTVSWGRDAGGLPVFGYPVRVIKPSYLATQLLRQTYSDGVSRPMIFPGSEWDIAGNTRHLSLRPHPLHLDLTTQATAVGNLRTRGPRFVTRLDEAQRLGLRGPFPFSEFDSNFNGTIDTEDTNGNGILDSGEDTNGNGVLDFGEDSNENGRLDALGLMGVWGVGTWRPASLYREGQWIVVAGSDNFPIYFSCVQTGVTGAAGSPPAWNSAVSPPQPAGYQITDAGTVWAYSPVLAPAYRFDADADGDGISDSIYTDLDLKVRERADGRRMIPIPAIKIIDLEALMNLSATGNFAAQFLRGPDGAPGAAGVDDNGINGTDDDGELGWPGTDDAMSLNGTTIAGPGGNEFGRGQHIHRSNQGLSSPWEINPQYVLNSNPATDGVSGTRPFENLRRYLGKPVGWVPLSAVEAANYEYLLMKIGSPVLSSSGGLVNVIPGSLGDANNALNVFRGVASPAPANYPRPGVPGSDLNGNRNLGEWFSGLYPGDPVAELHGFRTPLDFASAGASVTYDSMTNQWRPIFLRPTGNMAPVSNLHRFIRYFGYHTLGTMPAAWGRNGVPGAFIDDDGNGVQNFLNNGLPDIIEYGYGDDGEYVPFRTIALVNEPEESIVDPRIAVNEDRNGNNVLDPGEDLNGNGILENSGELPFGPDELAFLHMSETDMQVIAQDSRLESLLRFNLKDSARAAEIRRRLTTVSWSLKQRGHTFSVGQRAVETNFRPNEFALAGRSANETQRYAFPALAVNVPDIPSSGAGVPHFFQPLPYEFHKTLQQIAAARRPEASTETINLQRQRSIDLNRILVPAINAASTRPFSTWQSTTGYGVGDIIVPALVNLGGVNGMQRLPFEDTVNPNGILDPSEDTNGNGFLDQGCNRFYICTTAGTSSGSTPIAWPTRPGQTLTDSGVTWTCIEEQFIYRDLTPHPTRDLTRGSVSEWKRATFGVGPDQTPPYRMAVPGGGFLDRRAQEWWARHDRQRMARMIYVLLYMHAKGRDVDDPFAQNDLRQVLSDRQLREMAQFAVNVVDALDGDSVITKFEYDKNLANGWNLDDDAFNHADSTPYNPSDMGFNVDWQEDSAERGVVYGVEKQEIEFSEALAMVAARSYSDVDASGSFTSGVDTLKDHTATEWNDKIHQYMTWLELRNTGDSPIDFRDEDTNNNGVLDAGEDINFNGRLDFGFQYQIEVRPLSTAAKTGSSISAAVANDDGVRRLSWARGRVNPGSMFTIGSIGDSDNRTTPGDSNTARIQSRLRLDPVWTSGAVGPLTQYVPDTTWNPAGNLSILDLFHPQTPGTLAATDSDLSNVQGYTICAGPDPSWSGDLRRYSEGRRVNRIGEWLNHDTLNPDPANPSETDWAVTFILKRRLHPYRQPPQEVDATASNTTTTLPQAQDNPWIEIDRVGVELNYYTQDSDHTLNGTSTLPTTQYELRRFRPRTEPIDTRGFEDNTPGTELLTAIAGTAGAPPKATQLGTRSTERNRPLSRQLTLGDENGGNSRFNSLGRENDVSNSNYNANGFDQWQIHHDRHFASVAELLSIPMHGPRATNLRSYNNGKNTAGEMKFMTPDYPDSLSPMLTPAQQLLLDNRWYRLLSMLSVPSKAHTHARFEREDINGNGILDAGEDTNRNGVLDEQGWFRDPGKINWNTIRYPEVWAGLLDDSRAFNFTPLISPSQLNYMQDPNSMNRDWWKQLLISRDGFDAVSTIPLPGTLQSRPFRDFSFTARGNQSIEDTALRSRPAFPAAAVPVPSDPVQTNQRLLGVGTPAEHFAGQHDHQSRNHILSKVLGNSTNISNSFAVFIELSWFEVAEVPDASTGQNNIRIGAKLDDMPTHRGMFVIDRSLAMERITTGCLPPTRAAAAQTPFAFRNQSEPDSNGNGVFEQAEDLNGNGIRDNFDFKDLIIYRQIIR